MLFNSIAGKMVQDSFLDAIMRASAARKAETVKRLSYYNDESLEYIEQILAQTFSNSQNIKPCALNIVKKIVNNLAQVYAQPPKRTIEGTDQDKNIYNEILSSSALNARMKTAQRYTKLLKSILIRPVYRKGVIDLDVITGDVVDTEWNDTPDDLQTVLITHYPSSGRNDEITYSRWTIDTIETLDYRGQVISYEPNPYGILPFIPCWDKMPVSNEFWQEGGSDIVNIQECVAEKLSDLLYICKMQGFGAPWAKGIKNPTEFRLGPGSVTLLPENGELGFSAPQAPIEELIKAIDYLVKQIAIQNGLSASTMSVEPNPESGIAKVIGNAELQELRRDDQESFRAYENRLFEVIKTVWNFHNPGRTISETATLSIDFYDPKEPISPKDQASVWEARISLGLSSQVDIILEENPDITSREDALAFLLKIQEEQRILSENAGL